MNDPAKGGSAYLQSRISNARDALVETKVEPPKEPPADASASASKGAGGSGESK